jgi:hypothetical protein
MDKMLVPVSSESTKLFRFLDLSGELQDMVIDKYITEEEPDEVYCDVVFNGALPASIVRHETQTPLHRAGESIQSRYAARLESLMKSSTFQQHWYINSIGSSSSLSPRVRSPYWQFVRTCAFTAGHSQNAPVFS